MTSRPTRVTRVTRVTRFVRQHWPNAVWLCAIAVTDWLDQDVLAWTLLTTYLIWMVNYWPIARPDDRSSDQQDDQREP